MTKGLGQLTVPLIQGGMGIGISMGSLAGAVAREGGMGVISTANIGFQEEDFWENPREANRRALIKEIRKAKEIAQGKGLLAINAMVVTTNYAQAIKTACEEGIDAIISGAGVPMSLPEHIKGFDVLIAPMVSSGKAAKTICNVWSKRFQRLPDFIVIEGSKAGGHLGFSQDEAEKGTAKPLIDILKEVKDSVSGFISSMPIYVAGGIFEKADIKKMLDAGAAGIQMATRFIATKECDASQRFKDILINAKAEDAHILKSPVGMPGRGLSTPLVEKVKGGERVAPKRCIDCIVTCNPATTPYCINQALIDAFYGKYESGLFFCGSNVGRVNEMTDVAALVEELVGEWRKG